MAAHSKGGILMAVAKVRFFSQALGMCVTCNVLLPQRKDVALNRPVPVLWLLHGMHGSHSAWLMRSNIQRYAAPYGLAVVMPSGLNSFYTDMAHGMKFYSYIANELPETMSKFFNFSRKREDNFIAGLSMGGCGSLMIGLSQPEKYAAIGCFSAGASNFLPENLDQHYRDLAFGNAPIAGTYKDTFGNAQKILAENLPQPRIYHSCGSEDGLLNWAHETRSFFDSLPGHPFDYQYVERPGIHDWNFWDQEIQQFLRFLNLPKADKEYI